MNSLLEQIPSTFFTLLADIVLLISLIGINVWTETTTKEVVDKRKPHIYLIWTLLCFVSSIISFKASYQPDLWEFFRVVLILGGLTKLITSLVMVGRTSRLYNSLKTEKKQHHKVQRQQNNIVPKSLDKINIPDNTPRETIPEIYLTSAISSMAAYPARSSLPEQNSRLVQAVIDDFAALGWNKWDSSIHGQPEQYKRITRGNDPHSSFRIYEYSSASGHAKVTGSTGSMYLVSGNGCSCRDFHDRNLPCKHMYYLASRLTLPGYHDIKGSNDFLYRFTFAIAGGSQAKIKDYIKQHKGKVVERIDIDTTALIVNTSKTTQKVIDAQLEHVEVMTFDDLKALF